MVVASHSYIDRTACSHVILSKVDHSLKNKLPDRAFSFFSTFNVSEATISFKLNKLTTFSQKQSTCSQSPQYQYCQHVFYMYIQHKHNGNPFSVSQQWNCVRLLWHRKRSGMSVNCIGRCRFRQRSAGRSMVA